MVKSAEKWKTNETTIPGPLPVTFADAPGGHIGGPRLGGDFVQWDYQPGVQEPSSTKLIWESVATGRNRQRARYSKLPGTIHLCDGTLPGGLLPTGTLRDDGLGGNRVGHGSGSSRECCYARTE